MTPSPRWEPVEPTEGWDTGSELVDALESLLPGLGRHFRSDAGGRAVVLPLAALAGTAVAVTGEDSEGTAVLFVDPPSGGDATHVLDLLGDGADPVRVALPAGAEHEGLLAEAGQVSVPGGHGTLEFRLFRRAPQALADRDRLAAGPKVGETADSTDERSRWFESRHGGPG